MMEMKIKIEVPDLAAAIAKLAAAITPPDPNVLTPDELRQPQMPAPVAPAVNPPTAPASVPGPVPTAAAPAPVPTSAAPAPMTGPTAPPTNPAPPAPAAPAVPVTAPTYTLDQIAKAGASLVDAGKMEQLLGLLGKYGVAAVTQLSPDQYGAFATELRALGAQI